MTTHLFPDNTVFCNFGSVNQVQLLQQFLSGRGRWTEAVSFEVSRSADFVPALVGVAGAEWMGAPIEISDDAGRREVEGIRRSVFGGTQSEPLRHLGESQTLFIIRTQYGLGDATWISDDREAVEYASSQGIVVKETRHVVAELVQTGVMSDTAAFGMLEQMQQVGRSVTIPGRPADFWSL